MTERKTCGTCGPNGGLCEWRYNTCPFSECEKISGTRECAYHAAFRQQRERAEAAEARIAELEAQRDDALDIGRQEGLDVGRKEGLEVGRAQGMAARSFCPRCGEELL